jgi:lysozyme
MPPMSPGPWARRIAKHFEGLKLKAYICPAGKLTIGYGHIKTTKPGQVITSAEADRLFELDLAGHAAGVRRLLTGPTNQAQFDALVSFAFNLGVAALGRSTLLRLHNAGKFAEAAAQFDRWVYGKVNGKNTKLRGLVTRRAAERALYEGTTPVLR